MKCTFCGKEITIGTGKVLIKKDGTMINFCSNKCEKNMLKLKRKSRNTKWTDISKTIKSGKTTNASESKPEAKKKQSQKK